MYHWVLKPRLSKTQCIVGNLTLLFLRILCIQRLCNFSSSEWTKLQATRWRLVGQAGITVYALIQLVFCFHLSSFVIMKQIISILLNLCRCFKWNILNYVFSVTKMIVMHAVHVESFSSRQIGTIRFIGLFSRNWFLTLEFKRGVAKFCRVFRGERLLSLEFLRVKSQIQNFQGDFQKSMSSTTPCLDFFWNGSLLRNYLASICCL